MKRAVMIGGPMDGQVRTVDDGLAALRAYKPTREPAGYFKSRPTNTNTVQYVEVPAFGVFKLSTMSDAEVLQALVDHYAKMHADT